ncbi:MAG: SBBP repeat-containing protein [Bacteroidetes bacterium]|nr:SBBP repeat-containing protein [Bacteroidota bacterium]
MGTGLIYSTFIGGTNNEWANSIDIDVAGNIYITGETESTNYPTTIGAFQTSLGGFADVFVTKLNPTGTTVIYSTFIGGLNSDYGYGIVVDSVGSAFVSLKLTPLVMQLLLVKQHLQIIMSHRVHFRYQMVEGMMAL